jgi:ribonucleoside-diphosphate reductase alpha subunit
MNVIKRDKTKELFDTNKITLRISILIEGFDILPRLRNINIDNIITELNVSICDNIHTYEIDELAAQICASKSVKHPDYGHLASRIAMNNLQKKCPSTFSEAIFKLYNNGLINDRLYAVVLQNAQRIDKEIIPHLDYLIDYFGLSTLIKSYLLKIDENTLETPQYLFMRVSLAIHSNDLEKVFNNYFYFSHLYATHATPTLFNAGTINEQLSSCFLLGCNDTVNGIYKSISDIAKIQKSAGGIGLNLSDIRAKGSIIKSTGGLCTGLMPLLRVLNATARYINQGGKRAGSIAVYLEPWHSDIESFLLAKKNTGDENERARDLFYALWISDLFMERVEGDKMWSLMSPDICTGLTDVYGDEFVSLYTKYESEGKYVKQISARKLFTEIINSQIETGTPYMLYKDACNRKSNQKNIGTIKNSNLCAEIMEVSNDSEYAVCNLASIALQRFLREDGTYNYTRLGSVVEMLVENLDTIIDLNYYPTDECRTSNMNHRPIGIGVQGLADVFQILRIPFTSEEAKQLNINIFETIYYHALKKSNELAIEKGAYSSFCGSPISKGIFQFDFWGIKPSAKFNWDGLKESIMRNGIRNSQLIALMPTASTSQILGSNECIEPFTSNLYLRRTSSGEFTIINKYLVQHLLELNLWNDEMINELYKNRGSVESIKNLSSSFKEIYKSSYEISQKELINMSADRGAFVCQSQSLNLFFDVPTFNKLYSAHMYGWKRGLKTGSYYLRTLPKISMQSFNIEPKKKEVCSLEEGCISCGA